jgi:hypothetical protein
MALKMEFGPPYVEDIIVRLVLLAVAVFLVIHAIRNFKTVPSNRD